MIHDPCQYDVKAIAEFGLMDNDPGKESIFVKFKTSGGDFTWYGSLKPKQPGKEIGARDFTFATLAKLGWNGDTDAFANAMPCFNALPEGIRIDVGDDEWAPGKTTKNKVLNVIVPGYGRAKMDSGKAKSLLSEMKGDIKKAQQQVAMQKTEPDF